MPLISVYYSDHYTIPLPDAHRFPIRKYRMLRDALLTRGILQPSQLFQPPLCTKEQLLRCHTLEYVDAVLDGTLKPLEIRRIGFPWSTAMVQRSMATVGGCIAACYAALHDGCSGNLAGGTHHALPSSGEGYCVFNDCAVAIRELQQNGLIRTAAIIDLDVHQGNGNAVMFADDPSVLVFSMHGAKNYPFVKPPSTIDVALEDSTTDDEYLAQLALYLPFIMDWQPDIVLYQCGVDPLLHDTLGRLNLSYQCLQLRDWMVLSGCKNAGIPVMMALGGGYAKPIERTIDAQCNTYSVATSLFQ
jgi:acetoin utilization deacetylase AcuC-like enzyme